MDGRWTLVTLISGGVPEPLQRFESIVSVCKAVPPEGLKITGMNIEFQLFPVILHCGKLFCKRRHVFFFLFFLQIGERMQIFTREKLCLSKLLFHTQWCYWTVASWPNKMQNVPPVVLKRFFSLVSVILLLIQLFVSQSQTFVDDTFHYSQHDFEMKQCLCLSHVGERWFNRNPPEPGRFWCPVITG